MAHHRVEKNFTPTELKKLRAKFNLVSQDNGHTIRKEDAIVAIRAIGQNPSLKDSNKALADARLNTQATLTFEEFQLYAEKVWKEESMEHVLNEAFKRFDKNDNGTIDTKEFKDLMLNYGEALTQKEFEDLIRLADMNHDEFVRLFTEVLDD